MNSNVVYSGPAQITLAGQSFQVRAELLVDRSVEDSFSCAFVEAPAEIIGYLSANNDQAGTLITSEGRKYTVTGGSVSSSGDMFYLQATLASAIA
jgi:hypothetical protein